MAKASTPRRPAAKKEQRTWIVVADGGRARILESDHRNSGVTVRLDLASDARATAGKLAADRLPRTQESGNMARHGIEPRLALKDHEKRLFAARLAGYLKDLTWMTDAEVLDHLGPLGGQVRRLRKGV
jgi:hypothetical protein